MRLGCGQLPSGRLDRVREPFDVVSVGAVDEMTVEVLDRGIPEMLGDRGDGSAYHFAADLSTLGNIVGFGTTTCALRHGGHRRTCRTARPGCSRSMFLMSLVELLVGARHFAARCPGATAARSANCRADSPPRPGIRARVGAHRR